MKDSPLYIAILDKCVELMMVGSEGEREREREREGGRERDRERERQRERDRERVTYTYTYRAMLVLTYFLLYMSVFLLFNVMLFLCYLGLGYT